MSCCDSSVDHTSAALTAICDSIRLSFWSSWLRFAFSADRMSDSPNEPTHPIDEDEGRALIVSPADFLFIFILGFVVVLLVSAYCRTRAVQRPKTQ